MNNFCTGPYHRSKDDAIYSNPFHASILRLLLKVEFERIGSVVIQNDGVPLRRTLGHFSANFQIKEVILIST